MIALNPPGRRPLLAAGLSIILLTAAQAAEFRVLVQPEDYEAYVKTLPPEKLDVEKALAEKRPAYGGNLVSVEDGGQGAKAGLAPGWVLVNYNDKPYMDRPGGMEPGGPDGKTRKCDFITPAGESKTVNFKPGKIGITSGTWAHPEIFVLQKTPRGVWDRDMLIASQAWVGGRHDVTETALAKAQEAGMPDNPIQRYYRALLAVDRGADAKARKFWDEVMKDMADGYIPPYYFSGMRTVAWHLRDFAMLRRVVEIESVLPDRMQPADLDPWASAPAVSAGSLLTQARQRAAKQDLMPSVVNVPDEMWKRWGLVPPEFLQRGWCSLASPPRHRATCHFMPAKPVKNVLWEITLGLGATGAPDANFPNCLVVALMDRSQKDPGPGGGTEGKRVIGLTFFDQADGSRWTGFNGGLQWHTIFTQQAVPWYSEKEAAAILKSDNMDEHLPAPPPDKAIHLSIVRLGSEAEILVNNRTWSKMHVPDSVQDLGFFLLNVGTAVVIDKMELFPLGD